MTAEDIASDLIGDLAGVMRKALGSAAEQGMAQVQGAFDPLVERYDDLYAEWQITVDETGPFSAASRKAHRAFTDGCIELCPQFARIAGRDT